MKLSKLISRFRSECDDLAEPYLWSEEDVKAWFNEAEQEACRRSELLVDSTTDSITLIVAVAEDPWIPLSRRIVKPLRAREVAGLPLSVLHCQQMDATTGWELSTGTSLRALVTGMETYKIRSYPILAEDTSDIEIRLTVQRLPLRDMEEGDDEPEIPDQYHIKLLHWVKYLAYSVDDVDANDPNKANKHLALFEAEFGGANAMFDTFMRQHLNDSMMPEDFLT